MRLLLCCFVLLALTACESADHAEGHDTANESEHAAAETNASNDREEITAASLSAPIGPYSHAQRVGDALYLSGQIGLDPATGALADGVEAQTRQALANLDAVLTEAGFARTDVVQAQVFLADIDDYAAMNTVYADFFSTHRPARAALQVARLPRDAAVEIMFVAHR